MSEITFGKTVSLDQAANVILHTPMNRYLLEGEPGIGKSTLIKAIAAKLPTHEVAYIDVPNMDLGDIAMPVVDHETRTTKYYPNSRFKLETGKPAIIMLDEYTKGAQPVKNMLHPLLEVTNPRLGDMPIHPESIIFLTGNLSTDGVGDHYKYASQTRKSGSAGVSTTASRPSCWRGRVSIRMPSRHTQMQGKLRIRTSSTHASNRKALCLAARWNVHLTLLGFASCWIVTH
jgi:DNA polymerase III delta prime subunit